MAVWTMSPELASYGQGKKETGTAMNYDVLWVSFEKPAIIYLDRGHPLMGLSDSEFNRIILEAKQKIAKRENVLDRFEPWEVTGESPKALLLSRCRNQNERLLVNSYIQKWNTEKELP
jgi:hypothetical protein